MVSFLFSHSLSSPGSVRCRDHMTAPKRSHVILSWAAFLPNQSPNQNVWVEQVICERRGLVQMYPLSVEQRRGQRPLGQQLWSAVLHYETRVFLNSLYTQHTIYAIIYRYNGRSRSLPLLTSLKEIKSSSPESESSGPTAAPVSLQFHTCFALFCLIRCCSPDFFASSTRTLLSVHMLRAAVSDERIG